MTESVDDRIVSMKFDNAVFEQKLSHTIQSLDKLRASLDFANSKRGLDDLSRAGNTFNMGNMGGVIDGISGKFLALSTVAVTALATITSHAISAGSRMLGAFTFTPITDGFREFETNMNSIQTILANTKSDGSNLEDVNNALNQLNEYSDKTIYNFSQMARNIGTFTAAGVNLESSVNAIKGIANLAAISGSNSEQASTAMYQLSQALAAGKVSLMDWNSVVNAGMGGEVFKKALFETGKAMGSITNVPLTASFEEWEKKGGTFREQLQNGAITADVLSTTLSAFSGDLDEAALKQIGFSDAAAKQMVELGQLGIAAATEVKTLTQLFGTVKESIASGWSQSFRTVIGDFEESKRLFSGISRAIGGFVQESADNRNKMLDEWKFFGGRDILLQGLEDAFGAMANVFVAVKNAFRDIFPATTGVKLFELTQGFANFASKLEELTQGAMPTIKQLFSGFFAAIEIGVEILKGVGGLIGDIFGAITGVAGGPTLGFLKSISDFFIDLNKNLVDGGGIKEFFDNLGEAIRNPAEAIENIKEAISSMFSGGEIPGSGAVMTLFENLGERVQWIQDRFSGITNVLDGIWNHLSTWFGELGDKLAAVMNPGDYDAAVDTINVGLLGGIALILKKFLSNGLDLNLLSGFGGGIFRQINETLGALTERLKTMTFDIKANALLKIAAAVGILTASMAVLATIDSVGLTKALTAMGIGITQLVTAMTLMGKTGIGATKFTIMASGLVILSGAIGVLAISMKLLSTMSWDEIGKGLAAVTGLLVGLTASTRLIAADTGGLIAAGIAMGAMATALLILSTAVKSFAEMSWEDMAKGLTGVAVGIGALTTAMNFMPVSGMVQAGIGVIAISTGLRILAEAVQAFSVMSWGEMAQGLVGIAGGLAAMVLAMRLMPTSGMISAGSGLLILSGALVIMAKAVGDMGEIPFGEMAKGIGGLAVMLGILVIAMNTMTGTIAGAAALVIVSGALVILTQVLKELGQLSIGQIVAGIGAIAVTLAVLAAAAILVTGVLPQMVGLGVALGLIGASFALFGVGASLVAKAFEIMARSGAAGAKGIVEAIKTIITVVPTVETAIAKAIINMAKTILEGAPVLIKGIKVVLQHVLETVIELVPHIAKALSVIITQFLKLVREKIPEVVKTGFTMLMAFLEGVRKNISEIVKTVAEIVTGFLDALADKAPEIVDSVFNLFLEVLKNVAFKLGESVGAFAEVGIALIDGLLTGLKGSIGEVLTFFLELPGKIIGIIAEALGINSPSTKFMEIGNNIIFGLLQGLIDTVSKVLSWFTELPGNILKALGNLNRILLPKGIELIFGLVQGIAEKAVEIMSWFTSLPGKIVGWVGDVTQKLVQTGIDLITGLLTGIVDKFEDVSRWLFNLAWRISTAIPNPIDILFSVGKTIIRGLVDGFKEGWEAAKDFLGSLNPANYFNDINPYKGHAATNMVGTGLIVMQGLGNGLKEGWTGVTKWLETVDPAKSIGDQTVEGINEVISSISKELDSLDVMSPTITPVLDLTKVQAASRNIERLMGVTPIVPEVSYQTARTISTTAEVADTGSETPVYTGPSEVNFEQNIYAPTALSTNDIYRNTKSQIALAKEELNIK